MGRCSPSFSYLRYTNPAGLSALTEQPRGYVALEPPSPVDCESFFLYVGSEGKFRGAVLPGAVFPGRA
ncbi:hypothetical protein P3T31_002770 [Rhizobium sp. AN70]|nr:hypothetical protein [Rhizobium sp. AN70]